MPSIRADVVIIGGGVAGMSAALAAIGRRDVLLVTKESLDESSTRYAQGGIAAAIDMADTPELHFEDTMRAGAGICAADAVRVLVDEGPVRVRELVTGGTRFDREAGALALAREGGHTRSRILRAGGDATGAELQRSLGDLVRESAVRLVQDCEAVELVTSDGVCRGIEVVDHDGLVSTVEADAVVLATGGAGALFEVTTNPDVATADGLAMAIRAGAVVVDLEFVQFHPTALVASERPRPLVSEAVRGEGAVLRTDGGAALMEGKHPLADLAPRDVVSVAVFEAMIAAGKENVWLDATGIEDFSARFPTISGFCRDLSIDPGRDWLPVAPAAHYFCGGVVTDLSGRTSIERLYACGEVACTGIHGANRLASNSLLEGLVFGTRVGEVLARHDASPQTAEALAAPATEVVQAAGVGEPGNRKPSVEELQHLMSFNAGVVRSAAGLDSLARALASFDTSQQSEAGPQFANLHLVAQTLVRSALIRTETRGTHVREDFPDTDPAWARHLFQRYLSEPGGALSVEVRQ